VQSHYLVETTALQASLDGLNEPLPLVWILMIHELENCLFEDDKFGDDKAVSNSFVEAVHS
jgi:hypothetical protein